MNSRNRHTILLGAFVILAILSFFFSPWEAGAKQWCKEYELPFLSESDPLMLIVGRIFLFGIFDAIEMVASSFQIASEFGEGLSSSSGISLMILPVITVLAYYAGQIVMSRLNNYYEDEVVNDSSWEKFFDVFCIENGFTYLLCLLNYLLINVIGKLFSFACINHETLMSILGIGVIVLAAFIMFAVQFYFLLYMLVVGTPVLILFVPFLNNIIGVILFLIAEILCVAVVWRNYVADFALKYSFVVAKKVMSFVLLPFRILK